MALSPEILFNALAPLRPHTKESEMGAQANLSSDARLSLRTTDLKVTGRIAFQRKTTMEASPPARTP